jgi:flagellar biosynthetic protein FliR
MSVLEWIPTYVLLFFRVAGMFIYAPLFGSANIPKRVRVLMAAIISMGIATTITHQAVLPDSLWKLTIGIAGEIIFGLAMGLIASFIFIAVQWAGEIIGQQMGLNISEVFDPQFGGQNSIIGNIYFLLTLIIFLCIGGHHAMLIGVRESVRTLPLLSVGMSANLFELVIAMFHASTILAFQLSAPILITMLIVDLCLGFVGKTVPQLNLMSAGLSVRGMVGFLVLIFGIGLSNRVIRESMVDTMNKVLMAYSSRW